MLFQALHIYRSLLLDGLRLEYYGFDRLSDLLKLIIMKKILNKIGQVLQVVLLAPIKLPGRAVNILKYIAVGLGVLETVLEKEKDPPDEVSDDTEQGTLSERESSPEQRVEPTANGFKGADQGPKTADARTGERSEADENQ